MVLEGLAAMDTLTGNAGLTVIVIGLEVAGLPVAHSALDVITHVITFPLVNAALV